MGTNNPYGLKISEESLPLAAEDRFVVIGIREATLLCPSPASAASFGSAFNIARLTGHALTPVIDLRGLPNTYNDVIDFLYQFVRHTGDQQLHIIGSKHTAEAIENTEIKRYVSSIFVAEGGPLPKASFPINNINKDHNTDDKTREAAEELQSMMLYTEGARLDSFYPPEAIPENWSPWNSYEEFIKFITPEKLLEFTPTWLASSVGERHIINALRDMMPYLYNLQTNVATGYTLQLENGKNQLHLGYDEQYELINSYDDLIRASIFLSYIQMCHSKSLTVEFAMQYKNGIIECTPYHMGGASHVISPRTEQVIAGRAGVIAANTGAVFKTEINLLQDLLNKPKLKELELQHFFEQHPAFLRGLGYSDVYSHVILDRDDGTKLIPDFILQPFGSEWCDILDLKTPMQKIYVGGRDRKTLASGIHEVAAQLREYAAYFDSDLCRLRVQKKYGLNVYKPRMIAIVGGAIDMHDDLQMRRVMTAYPDMRFVTFNQLIDIASTRLLI